MPAEMEETLGASWRLLLSEEFGKPYYKTLAKFVQEEYQKKTIYPPHSLIFRAFNETPLEKVKVVILGQDPYHEEGEAVGLAFSTPEHSKTPPSLRNINKELDAEYPERAPHNRKDLKLWANQGVLLLNTTLTVEAHKPLSHAGKGWETFTDNIILRLSQNRKGLVFILWGNNSRKKAKLIDSSSHLILYSPHPSPLSASRGFFGCNHFTLTNDYLKIRGEKPIEW